MALTLKVAAFDVTEFLRGQPGDGMQPYDPDNVEPLFTDSPIGEGGRWTSTKAGLAERVFPLYLNDNSPAALRTLEQTLNRALAQAPGITAEWQPPGSAASSYWDVEAGRFEPDYNLMLDKHGYMAGVLRLWTGPYAHTATQRIVGTTAGTGALLTVAVPTVAGDVAALPQYELTAGSNQPGSGRLMGVAVLPHPSYSAVIPVASFSKGAGMASGQVVGASGVHGSQIWTGNQGPVVDTVGGHVPIFSVTLRPIEAYAGRRHRILTTVRRKPVFGEQYSFRAYTKEGHAFGPTVTATGVFGMQVLDLGVLSVPSQPASAAAPVVEIRGGLDPDWANPGDSAPWVTPLGFVGFGPLYVVPEDSTTLTIDTRDEALAADRFAGPFSASFMPLLDRKDELSRTWTLAQSATTLGSQPLLVYSADGMSGNANAAASTILGFRRFSHAVDTDSSDYLRIESVIQTFGAEVGTKFIAVMKEMGPNQYVAAELKMSTSPYLAIVARGTSANPTALASVALNATAPNVAAWRLDLVAQGAGFTARVVDARERKIPVACVAANATIFAMPGQPGLYGGATFLNSPGGNLNIKSFRAIKTASQPQPADVYQYDGTSDQISLGNSGDARQRGMESLTRGRTPDVAPTAARVSVLQFPLPEGATDDALSVTIRLRERFRFAR